VSDGFEASDDGTGTLAANLVDSHDDRVSIVVVQVP
jgi:hypothetical protein